MERPSYTPSPDVEVSRRDQTTHMWSLLPATKPSIETDGPHKPSSKYYGRATCQPRPSSPSSETATWARKRYSRKPVFHLPLPAPIHTPTAKEGYTREAFHLSGVIDLTLESLEGPPPGVRPIYSMPIFASLVNHGSPGKSLTLRGIINAIQNRFEWYGRCAVF